MPLVATAPTPPFLLKSFSIQFGVNFPIIPKVDGEGNPVTWTDANGDPQPAFEMGSTYIQAQTQDAQGIAGPSLEGNENDFSDDFYVDLKALFDKHLPAFLAATNGTVVGVVTE